jgi:hypothetical protein
MGAEEDCNDDNQSDSFCKGRVRVLGAFGDSSESIGSRNGDSGSGSFINIKFELDIHCREQQNGLEMATDKSRY